MKIKLSLLLTLLALLPLTSNAQPLPEAVENAIKSYNAWNQVELNGKLQLDNIIINPSIKIEMQRAKEILISARVPFYGELGRIEIDTTGILIVNRQKKLYCREEAGDILKSIPASLEDLQCILLARIFNLGSGQINDLSASSFNYTNESDCIVCVPKNQPLNGNIQYGFTLGYDALLQAIYATTTYSNLALLIEYFSLDNGKYELQLQYTDSQQHTNATTIKFDAPKWETSSMQHWIENPKYKRVGIKEMLRSL